MMKIVDKEGRGRRLSDKEARGQEEEREKGKQIRCE
jgi:hypothetical protein